jgi:hypothetical protein
MSDITGVVQEIQTRDVSGGKKAYNIVVGGESYGAGLYAPKCKVGDYVKFTLDEARGYKNVGRGSLQVSKNKPPADAVAAAAATALPKSSDGSSVDRKQDTISRQSAMNTAIQFMTLLSANDALGLPASAKGKKVEVLEAMLSKYTQDFYERNTGVKWKDIAPATKGSTNEASEPEVEEDDTPADEQWD